MTEATQVAAIAAGLTDLQRDWIIHPHWHGSGVTQFALIDALDTKLGPPMVHMFTLRWDRLTDLGLAVRAHLMQERP